MCGAPAGSTRRERSTPEGAAGVDGCLTFSSILRTPLHSTRNPCLQLLQCDGFETASDLQGCRSARLFAKPAAAWLGRLGRKEGGSAWRRRGLSAEFAELHFSVSHRNSGGGVCGQLRIMLLALAITRCPCARGLPLPRLRCNTFYIRLQGSHLICEIMKSFKLI